MRRVSIIGLGNLFKGDYGAGFHVLESLGREPLNDEVFIGYFGEDPRWAGGLLYGSDLAVAVGAFPFGGNPGMLHVWTYNVFLEHSDWMACDCREIEFLSHAILRADLAGGLPHEILFFWIEPLATEGVGLSKQVQKAVRRTASMIKQKLVDGDFLHEKALGVSRFLRMPTTRGIYA